VAHLGVRPRNIAGRDLRWWVEAARRGCGARGWRVLGFLLKQRIQVCLSDAHSLGDLDHDALVERQFVALLDRATLLPICVAEESARLVIDHDAAIEGVEFEIAILPALLLAAEIICVETAKLCDGGGILGGGDSGGVERVPQRRCHGGEMGMLHAMTGAHGIGAAAAAAAAMWRRRRRRRRRNGDVKAEVRRCGDARGPKREST
jgi:hypothetical protein